jgi:hypothetical protein
MALGQADQTVAPGCLSGTLRVRAGDPLLLCVPWDRRTRPPYVAFFTNSPQFFRINATDRQHYYHIPPLCWLRRQMTTAGLPASPSPTRG